MAGKKRELCERISERLLQIKSLREAAAESGNTEINEMITGSLDRMYLRLSEQYEELLKTR